MVLYSQMNICETWIVYWIWLHNSASYVDMYHSVCFTFSWWLKNLPSITDSVRPLVNEWNHVFPGAADDACKSWLLNFAASAIMATDITSGLYLKHSVIDKL